MASASALSVRTRMQVNLRGAAAGVAQAFHQLAQSRSRLGDEVVPGVPQVVKVHSGETGRGDGGNPGPVPEGAVAEQLALGTGEQ
jgi:hypothetical protein